MAHVKEKTSTPKDDKTKVSSSKAHAAPTTKSEAETQIRDLLKRHSKSLHALAKL